MKKRALRLAATTFVLAIIFTTSIIAQSPDDNQRRGKRPSPTERADKMLDRMTKKLALNDYQIDQIKALQENTITAAKSIKDSDLERAEKKEALKGLRKEHKENIKTVLDAEQLEKFEKWEAKRAQKKGRKGKRKGARGEQPVLDNMQDISE